MLALPADDKLAGDGKERGQGDDHEIVRAEEDAEAQSGDERAERIERRQLMPARPGILRQQRRDQRHEDLPKGNVKMPPQQAAEEQGAQAGNLVEAGLESEDLSLESFGFHLAPREWNSLESYPRYGAREGILSGVNGKVIVEMSLVCGVQLQGGSAIAGKQGEGIDRM